MSHESLPDDGWGRIKERCRNCPRGRDSEGEPYCVHPWRRLIAMTIASGDPVTYHHLASAWDMGASIGSVVDTDQRPSIEIFEEQPEQPIGTTVFRIISTRKT